MPTITFLPDNVTEEYSDGERVFDVGLRAKIAIETACVGQGTCGLCRVRVVDGEASLNPFTDEEQKHLGNVYFLTKVRLSCRAIASGGDIVVELAPKRKRRGKQSRPPRT